MNWSQAVKEYPKLLETAKHQTGMRQITGLRILGPGMPLESEAMKVLAEQGLVDFQPADKHLLELEFDNVREGKSIDARPELPLLIRY
jgi:hypothetical protein